MGWFRSAPDPARQAATPGLTDPGATRISSGTRIVGTVEGATEVLIDGEVEGEVRLEKAVLVGVTGRVKGVLRGGTVRVAGKVEGDVHGRERIELLAGGSVEGDLLAPRVVVNEGAFFSGRVAMKEMAPGASDSARSGKPGRGPAHSSRKDPSARAKGPSASSEREVPVDSPQPAEKPVAANSAAPENASSVGEKID